MLAPIKHGVSRLLDVAFPPSCAACGAGTVEELGVERGFCVGCRLDLPVLEEPLCDRCASPVLGEPTNGAIDCPVCRGERWAFDAVVALGAYEGLLRRLVLDAKRPAGEGAAAALGRLLAARRADRLAGVERPVVVPVPQHWRRRLGRGADGVAALASGLAAGLGTSTTSALVRTRATPRQTEVAPSDRTANVRGAFRVVRPQRLLGKNVLLVDDVFTTGATCNAAARVLVRAGAARVVAVVAARRLTPR